MVGEVSSIMGDLFNFEFISILKIAHKISVQLGKTSVETNDIIAAIIIMEESQAHRIIYSMVKGIDHDMTEENIQSAKDNYDLIELEDIIFNPHVLEIFNIASNESIFLGSTEEEKAGSEHLLLALLSRPYFKSYVLFSKSIVSYNTIKSFILSENGDKHEYFKFTRPLNLENVPVPKLYKYIPFDEKILVSILIDGKIKYSTPNELNDKFEFSYLVNKLIDFNTISLDDNDFKNEHRKELQKVLPTLNQSEIEDVANLSIEIIKPFEKVIKEVLNNTLDSISDIILPVFQELMGGNHLASTSFSESYSINPMWAHYANNHNGVVIIFNHNHEYFNESFYNFGSSPINYNEIPNKLNILQEHLQKEGEEYCSFMLFLNKSLQWRYEQEWRLIKKINTLEYTRIKDVNIFLDSIPTDAIEGVIFGLDVDEVSKQSIKETIKSFNDSQHIKTYNLVQVRETYGFGLDEF